MFQGLSEGRETENKAAASSVLPLCLNLAQKTPSGNPLLPDKVMLCLLLPFSTQFYQSHPPMPSCLALHLGQGLS